MGARTYAGAHAHHVDQGRSLACRHVHPAEAQGVAARHRRHGIGIVGQQGAFHVAEACRRRVHHAGVDHVHAAHVLHRQGVAHQIADADFAAACRLAQADLRCFQFMLRAAGGAGRQLATTTGGAHLVAHHGAGVRVHDRLVGQRVHAGRRTGRQLAGQPCAVEGAAGGQRAQGQAAIGCIDQDQGLAQGRCTDLHRERVAHRLAHLHLGTGARVGGLGDHHAGRGNRRLRGAGAGTGGRIITGTDHGVVHRAHGLVIDRGGVGHRVGARHGAHRQRAHQRVGVVAGVRTGIGHRTEGQARAQRVGQHHVAGGDRVDHRGGQRVGDRVVHAHRTGRAGRLAVAHRRRRHRRAGAAVRRAGRVGADHGVVHRAHGLVIDRGCVGHRVGARHRAHRQRAHQRVGAVAGVRTGIGHRTEGQPRAQRVGQRRHRGGLRVRHHRRQRVGDGVAHRYRTARAGRLAVCHRRPGIDVSTDDVRIGIRDRQRHAAHRGLVAGTGQAAAVLTRIADGKRFGERDDVAAIHRDRSCIGVGFVGGVGCGAQGIDHCCVHRRLDGHSVIDGGIDPGLAQGERGRVAPAAGILGGRRAIERLPAVHDRRDRQRGRRRQGGKRVHAMDLACFADQVDSAPGHGGAERTRDLANWKHRAIRSHAIQVVRTSRIVAARCQQVAVRQRHEVTRRCDVRRERSAKTAR